MKNILIDIPRSASQGRYYRAQGAPVQKMSPRVNGKLQIRQNDFSMVRTWIDSSVTCQLFNNSTGNLVGVFNPVPTSTDSISYSYANFVLADEAMANMRSNISKAVLDLGEMFATRQKTINSVTGVVETLTRAYTSLRRRDWKSFERALGIKARRRKFEKPADAWLSYTYGWSPLVQSVWQMIDHPFSVPSTVCHGTAKDSYPSSKEFQGANFFSNTRVEHSIRAHARVSVTVKGAWIQAASQYGINNPALTAWNLVPYSFVVEWFIPVGDFLERLGTFAGLEFSDYSVTEVSDWRRWWMCTDQRKFGPPGVSWRPSRTLSERQRVYEKNRRLAGFQPYGLPSFGSGLSTSRFTSALALMQKAFSKPNWYK